jgi:alpha-glucosidase/alpha-D-xyloside xylohydrolase
MPLMRALWLAFPADPRALAVDDAYMWGENLLVAPVTTASAKDRTVYLPHGIWFDYWTGETITGGFDHTRPVDLATMPLYVKAGSILPLGPVKQSALEKSSDPLELHIFPGSDGQLTLYEDDGVTMEHTRGISSTIDIRWHDQTRSLSLGLAPNSTMHPFTTQKLNVKLVGSSTVKTVEFHGSSTTVVL